MFKFWDKDQKQDFVNNAFSSVANKYDLMNDLMSFGIHRIWKDNFVDLIPSGGKIIDMASGTGDIGIKYAEKMKKFNIDFDLTLCDINSDMLEKAKEKFIEKNLNIDNIKFNISPAEKTQFPDNEFDCYTVVFGIRNFGDLKASLKESNRILKSGGKFLCMEFSMPDHMFLNFAHEQYLTKIIPLIGQFIAKDRQSYEYLAESIKNFPAEFEFINMIESSGFIKITSTPILNGICRIYQAIKL